MKKWMIAGSVCLLAFAACKRDDDGNDNVNTTDRDFVTMASLSNNAEIAAGQVAATKGNNSLVKSFGQQMVSEHTVAQADLKNRATTLGLTAPDSVVSNTKL